MQGVGTPGGPQQQQPQGAAQNAAAGNAPPGQPPAPNAWPYEAADSQLVARLGTYAMGELMNRLGTAMHNGLLAEIERLGDYLQRDASLQRNENDMRDANMVSSAWWDVCTWRVCVRQWTCAGTYCDQYISLRLCATEVPYLHSVLSTHSLFFCFQA